MNRYAINDDGVLVWVATGDLCSYEDAEKERDLLIERFERRIKALREYNKKMEARRYDLMVRMAWAQSRLEQLPSGIAREYTLAELEQVELNGGCIGDDAILHAGTAAWLILQEGLKED